MGCSNLLHNREAQATADALTACPRGIAPVEAFKQMGQIIFAEARALVCYTQLAPFSATVDAHPHHPAIGAIAKGIIQQVEQGPMQPGTVAAQLQLGRGMQLEPDSARVGQGPQVGPHLLHQGGQVHQASALGRTRQAVLQARKFEQIANQLLEPQQFPL